METKVIKISKENYEWLCELAGKMQTEEKRSVSFDAALAKLRKNRTVSDLAGSWRLNDKEAEKLLKSMKKGWTVWKKYA